MEIFGKLKGGAVQMAQLALARYCIYLEKQAGSVNIAHAITELNQEYRLVAPDRLADLVSDIQYAYAYQKNQLIDEMSRAGYWKFTAESGIAKVKDDLIRQLQDLAHAA